MGIVVSFFGSIWSFIKRAGLWLKENPIALVGMLGTLLGAFLMWKRSSNKIASLEDAVAVKATMVKVAKAEGKAEALEAQADEVSEEREELKREIAASKKRVVEIHEGKPIEGMSDDEIAKMFSSSGL